MTRDRGPIIVALFVIAVFAGPPICSVIAEVPSRRAIRAAAEATLADANSRKASGNGADNGGLSDILAGCTIATVRFEPPTTWFECEAGRRLRVMFAGRHVAKSAHETGLKYRVSHVIDSNSYILLTCDDAGRCERLKEAPGTSK